MGYPYGFYKMWVIVLSRVGLQYSSKRIILKMAVQTCFTCYFTFSYWIYYSIDKVYWFKKINNFGVSRNICFGVFWFKKRFVYNIYVCLPVCSAGETTKQLISTRLATNVSTRLIIIHRFTQSLAHNDQVLSDVTGRTLTDLVGLSWGWVSIRLVFLLIWILFL